MELAARGHEVHFITYANPIRLDPDTPRIHYHEVEVSNYPLFQYPPYCLALAGRMAEVAQSYQLDVLHVHYAIPHSIAALLARQMVAGARRLPYITTLHGTDITLVGADPSYFGITKFSIEKSDGITAVSDTLREQTVEIFGVPNEIRVIKNFVNCELYHPDNEKKGAAASAPFFSLSGWYSSQFTKFLITRISFGTPKISTVCSRRVSLTAVMPSDFSMENFVIPKYEGSAPTSVISVPCSVVMYGSRRTLATICCASSAAIECGIA